MNLLGDDEARGQGETVVERPDKKKKKTREEGAKHKERRRRTDSHHRKEKKKDGGMHDLHKSVPQSFLAQYFNFSHYFDYESSYYIHTCTVRSGGLRYFVALFGGRPPTTDNLKKYF